MIELPPETKTWKKAIIAHNSAFNNEQSHTVLLAIKAMLE